MSELPLITRIRTKEGDCQIDYNSLANLPSIKNISIDSTLSKSGQAADAKTVGDAIGNLSTLNTTNKNNLVNAINEVDADVTAINEDLSKKASTTYVDNKVSGYAPKNHSSAETTYGSASDTNYGHVKLSDSKDFNYDVSKGVAATPAALATMYLDIANRIANPLGATDISIKEVTVTSGSTNNDITVRYFDLFTAPATGLYSIHCVANFLPNANGWRSAQLSTHIGGHMVQAVSEENAQTQFCLNDFVYLNKDDVVKVGFRQTSGQDLRCEYAGRYSYINLQGL